MDYLIKWLYCDNSEKNNLVNPTENIIENNINKLVSTKNNSGKTMFDILLDNNNFTMFTKIGEYMPSETCLKLTNKIIENFEIIDKIPDINLVSQIYIEGINYFMNSLLTMKQNILYELNDY